MLPGLSSFSSVLFKAIFAGWLLMAVVSCTVVKKYQPNKPFVYKTNINLIGNFPSDEKESLVSGLKGQLDDSLRARRLDKLLWSVLKNPPLYDSTNADKSILFMRALLVSLGYFHDSISYKGTIIRHSKDQFRTIITFDVKPGRQWKLDSIAYTIKHPELQRLTDSTRPNAFIKKGDPFAKAPISAELDRLTELYRNNGYLRFTRDEIVGVWDTLDVALLQPSLDPFEQLELLQRLRERRDKPTVNLELRLRNIDSARLTRYYNGNVTIYPDYSIDTIGLQKKETMVKGIRIIQFRNTFKPKMFPSNIYLPYGTVYSQRRYIRTINRLNIIGAWQIVNIEQAPRKDQDTVDYVIKLTPAKKRLFSANLEGSFNQNSISGNLFGISANAGLQNRNFLKSANLANTNLRYGIEFSNQNGWSKAATGTVIGGLAGGVTGGLINKKHPLIGAIVSGLVTGSVGYGIGRNMDKKDGRIGTRQLIQTKQISLSHNIYFPRAIIFDRWIRDNRKDNWRTILSLNAANTDRRFLYNLTTLNGSWGYEYQYRTLFLGLKFPNIEYSFLDKRDSLNKLIDANPSLRNIFTDGLVFSAAANLTLTGGTQNRPTIFRANFEGAPLFAGFFHSPFLDSQVYRFIKIDAEFAHLIRYKKSAIALRVFAGAGIADPFNNTVSSTKKNALPFFKQYFGGGPNSMRAWALRRLGQGSTIKQFNGTNGTPDRYGDVQLEANAEYRFPIFKAVGIPVNGAVFTDIGNVWFLKKKAGDPEQVFNTGRLGKDIAIGAGAGLRIDFGFFVVRLDYSYKVKDPSPSPEYAAVQNKWFGYSFFKGDQFQLGIGYPFIF